MISNRVTRVCVNIERLERSNLSRQLKDKGHQVRTMGVLSAMEHIFNETATQNAGKQASGTGTQGKSWSKSEISITGKGKGEENNGKSKGKSKGTESAIQVSKSSGDGKTGVSDVESLKPETSVEDQESVQIGQVCITETSLIHKEWSLDERSDDWSLDERNNDKSYVGWHEDCEQICNTTVSSFSLQSSERVNANLDTGATVDALLSNFDREGVGDGMF